MSKEIAFGSRTCFTLIFGTGKFEGVVSEEQIAFLEKRQTDAPVKNYKSSILAGARAGLYSEEIASILADSGNGQVKRFSERFKHRVKKHIEEFRGPEDLTPPKTR